MADERDFNKEQIETLIKSAWDNPLPDELLLLRAKFEERLAELGIKAFQFEKNFGVEYKKLNRLLDGDIKKNDLIPFIKLGLFVGYSQKKATEIFATYLAKEHEADLIQAKKNAFILNTFDLPVLKKIGVINTTTNFEHIEKRINEIFGLKSILDYNTEETGAALSSTTVRPKNEKNRKYFKDKSRDIFKLINNPNRYDKQALIDYFPKIRWHSTDIENGLPNVIKSLFNLGITVIFQPKIPSLQMRGATFEVNSKPCIVLTDYRGSYPTMWFAFLHELFHVLFDWDEIMLKRYHLSDEENDLFVLRHKEEEANEFAREYLFPKSKIETVGSKIKQPFIVKDFAFEHHVHPSIIYSNYAYEFSSDENNLWAKFDKQIRPDMDFLIEKLSGGLSHSSTISDYANYYSNKIFNTYRNEPEEK
jgi:HTH-type transcriptional regulator / antitoxin HigA